MWLRFYTIAILSLAGSCIHITNQEYAINVDDLFSPICREGKIVKGRYYAPDNLFSIATPPLFQGNVDEDFGGKNLRTVIFRDDFGRLQRVEMTCLMPEIWEFLSLNPSQYRALVEGFYRDLLEPGILSSFSGAKTLLAEPYESAGINGFFAVIKVPQGSHLQNVQTGLRADSIRSYFIFTASNQLVAVSWQDTLSPLAENDIEGWRARLLPVVLRLCTSYQPGSCAKEGCEARVRQEFL